MKTFKKNIIAVAIASSLILPATAFATNGMKSEGDGAKARGTGGAGVAMANENGSIVTNPAAVVGVGDRMDVAIGLFSPSPRKYSLTGNINGFDGAQTSGQDLFVIPAFGMAFPIDSQSAWSIGLNAAGGMNTEYSTNFGAVPTGATTKTGINLAQLFLSGTYGRKVGSNTTLGISAIAAYQTFEATGLEAFAGASTDGNAVSNNGVDSSTGFGVKIGIQGDITPEFSYGVAYQPKITMSKFDKYKGLFPNQGEMDIPSTFTAGIAYDLNPKTTIVFDYLYIDYDGVAAIGNKVSEFPGKAFGATDGPGFGWDSINVFKLGVAYATSADWTYRVGWNHGDNPVQSDEVSVSFLAPGVTTDHLTLGFTNRIDANSEYTVDFVHSFKNSSSGAFSSAFGSGTMEVEMEQNFLEIAYSKMF
ncbi:hypothetical protein MNBD_GAMMA22-1001 [hydrothermal vent metagenome]|uniref:Facilitator of salicylate uptake n=1 Tax=hydrothermal vent metagenome TaxID=652676 RepID=A0A3B0ZTZ3_9ZZZZ